MRTLVTGGSGFLGSALVRRLVGLGRDVVVFDNNFRGTRERLAEVWDRISFIEGDIRDREAVFRAAEGCAALHHLAFVNGTRYFYEKPELVLDVGVKGALNTLEAAIEHGIGTYVLASSSEVYQQPTHIPTTESERAIIPDVTNPRFSYAGGKLISELLAINFLRHHPTRLVIFRPHNVFGPNMGFEHVIPELMQKIAAVGEGGALSIQGSGEETRAFCFVEDAVDQILTIEDKGVDGELYHIGQSREITIKQLIMDIAGALGMTISVVPGELRAGGTTRRCPSIDKVRALGYAGQDHYAEGLAETVRWYAGYFAQPGR